LCALRRRIGLHHQQRFSSSELGPMIIQPVTKAEASLHETTGASGGIGEFTGRLPFGGWVTVLLVLGRPRGLPIERVVPAAAPRHEPLHLHFGSFHGWVVAPFRMFQPHVSNRAQMGTVGGPIVFSLKHEHAHRFVVALGINHRFFVSQHAV
jgi:hypothetical protein